MQFKSEWIKDIQDAGPQLKVADALIDKIESEIEFHIGKIETLLLKKKILQERILSVCEYVETGKTLLNRN